MTTRLLIIRHGNTFTPEEEPRRVGCKTDIPLVESGIVQAQALGRYLKTNDLIPDVIFSSELQRAQQTASVMMRTAGSSIPVHIDTAFNEIDHGPDENKTDADIIDRLGHKALDDWNNHGVVPQDWIVDPRSIQQSWIKLGADCHTVLKDKTICMVSSGGIIKFAPVLLQDGVLPEGQSPKVSTGSMSLFIYDEAQGTWICDYWNKRP